VNARRLMNQSSVTSDMHQWLQSREAFNLINSGRIDEYVTRWEHRMADAVDDLALRRKLLSERAQYFSRRPSVISSINAWREYRAAIGPESDDWENATLTLASELAQAGDYRAALALWTERLEYQRAKGTDEVAYLLLSISDAQRALGMMDEARQSLDAAEKAINLQAKTAKDPGSDKYLRKELAKLREAFAR